jgi:hypothetical protein
VVDGAAGLAGVGYGRRRRYWRRGKKIGGGGPEQRSGDGLDVLKMKDDVHDEVEGDL